MVRFQIAFLCTLLCSFTLTAQDRSLKKVRHLDQLLGESKFDSLLRFERECALEFHKLINQYRKDNRRKVLVWNDSLWLAARNHTDYLIYNTVFDHSQDSKRPLYSGVSPTERCKFVFDKSNVDYACGENIALNYIGASNAVDAANLVFEQWKESKGHNENMLSATYNEHGMAMRIVLDEDHKQGSFKTAYFTDLFAQAYRKASQGNFAQNTMVSEATYAYDYKATSNNNPTKIGTTLIKKELGNAFYYTKVQDFMAGNAKRNTELAKKTAKRNAEFLAAFSKNREHMKEMKAQNWYTYSTCMEVPGNVIQKISGKYKNRFTAAVVAFKPDKFNITEIAASVFHQWKATITPDAVKYAYHVALKRKGDHYIVCAALEQVL